MVCSDFQILFHGESLSLENTYVVLLCYHAHEMRAWYSDDLRKEVLRVSSE